MGLFTSISTGVTQFFYEPAQGLARSPQAFGSGIARGTVGLVQYSLYGVATTTSHIFGAVSKGLASFASGYRADKKGQPQQVNGVASGIYNGTVGLFLQPSRGMTQDGPRGAVSGVVFGATGFLVLPMAGILASLSTAARSGMENTIMNVLRLMQHCYVY